MATISNTPRPGYVWDATDNVWYPIGVGAHQHTNAADTPAVMPYSTYAAAGKNKIINGDLNINQRGFTSSTSNGYMFDRFSAYRDNGTVTYSAESFTLGTAPVTGYEAKNFLRVVTSGQTASNAAANFSQGIESVRTFAGQTVTISFWAKAGSGTPRVAVEFQQQFGSGGSPSSSVGVYAGQVTLSTSWTRYTLTVAVPSIAGKTIGTTTDGAIQLVLWVSGGTDFNSRIGSLGIQSGTFDFWGFQVEAGSNMTAFQTATGNPASELAACQRYYFRASVDTTSYRLLGQGTVTSVNNCDIAVNLPVQMRTIPASLETSAMSTFYYEPAGGSTPTSISLSSAATQNIGRVSVAKTSSFTVGYAIGLFSNNTPAYLGFSAEL